MADAKAISTPMETNLQLNPNKTENKDLDVPYQNLVGALMCLGVNTRPDIVHAVNKLSQYNNSYTIEYWKCLKQILRYIKFIKDLCLVMKGVKMY